MSIGCFRDDVHIVSTNGNRTKFKKSRNNFIDFNFSVNHEK